jgi:AcrR family transcriptional regulator
MTATGRRYGQKTASQRLGDRRSRLMEAALDAFGTEGYGSVSIEQLCARAGLSTRSFYELFANREALLIALHDELNEEALRAVVRALADVDPTDLRARARAGLTAYFRVMTSDRRHARIALVESVGVSREAEGHRQAAIGRFADLLELEAGRLAELGLLPRRDQRLTAVALVGAVNGLINTWTADPDWDAHLDDVIAVATDLIVAGLSAPAR